MWAAINFQPLRCRRPTILARSISNASPNRARVPRYGAILRRMEQIDLRREATPKRISSLVVLLGAGVIAWHWQELRHFSIATVRTARIGIAAVISVLDYRRTYSKTYETESDRLQAISECHTRAAGYTLKALLANGGVFIKLGQHLASSIIVPIEWSVTMRPCLDRCEQSTLEDLQRLFYEDTGMQIETIFSEFDPEPIGVASLAQVHKATHRATGMKVAVKLQHPHLQEFATIDLASTDIILQIIKRIYPEFEFSWLGREMRMNLPLEMNFIHEASNAARVAHNFEETVPNSPLYIPKVFSATKRTLVMEFIEGGKVNDKEFLAMHGIDRNKLSQELCKIFSEQVYIHGFFHADPHQGNLLIRPSTRDHGLNFDIVLLDHGLYFDIPDELRMNYARFWLSLLSPPTETNRQDRQKYASLIGNIGPERYSVFEAALTGRPSGTFGGKKQGQGRLAAWQQAAGMLDMGNLADEEIDKLRGMLASNADIMVAMFDILRKVDSKVLMLLKLNELTRALDHALSTTHPPYRVFLIVAQYCNRAVWQDDRHRLQETRRRDSMQTLAYFRRYMGGWLAYTFRRIGFGAVANWMDWQANWTLAKAWIFGLFTTGLEGAWRARAGLQ